MEWQANQMHLTPKTKLYITTVNRPGARKKITMAASRPATAEDPTKLLRLQALKLPAAGKAIPRAPQALPAAHSQASRSAAVGCG